MKDYYERNPLTKETILTTINKSARQVWIDIGNHMRKYDENVWVKALLTKPNVDILIIKDLRFPNEAKQVLDHNGILLKVTKPGSPIIADGADDPLEDWTNWQAIIENTGTLHDLNQKALELIKFYNLGN